MSLDIQEILRQRRERVKSTLKEVPNEMAQLLPDRLFPDVTDPWRAQLEEFLAAHPHDTLCHAEVDETLHVVYCPKERRGLWVSVQGDARGVGPLQERGLGAMSEICAELGFE